MNTNFFGNLGSYGNVPPFGNIPGIGNINAYINRTMTASLVGGLGLSAIISFLVQGQINKGMINANLYQQEILRNLGFFNK